MNHDDHRQHQDHAQDHDEIEIDVQATFTEGFWDDRYGSADAVWSGNPNAQLVQHVAGLEPGTALDVGSGEGADAIWLATRGWQVTGLDISTVGLRRSAQLAEAAAVADRTRWQQADLLTWEPTDRFDLVSAHFIHPPTSAARRSLHSRLTRAVRPGGWLLIVGHHPVDMHAMTKHAGMADLFYTAEEVAAELDPAAWEVLTADAPTRASFTPDGTPVTFTDAVLFARRR
jgi:SAM-dependent methyltransferase